MHKCPPRVAIGAYGNHALRSGNSEYIYEECEIDLFFDLVDLMIDLGQPIEQTNREVHVNW